MKPGTEPACQPHPIGFGGFFSRLLRLNQIVSVFYWHSDRSLCQGSRQEGRRGYDNRLIKSGRALISKLFTLSWHVSIYTLLKSLHRAYFSLKTLASEGWNSSFSLPYRCMFQNLVLNLTSKLYYTDLSIRGRNSYTGSFITLHQSCSTNQTTELVVQPPVCYLIDSRGPYLKAQCTGYVNIQTGT